VPIPGNLRCASCSHTSFALYNHSNFLAPMSVEKKMDMLFDTIDHDKGGTVDAEELAIVMRKNEELSFSASLEKAIDMVAKFDVDGNGVSLKICAVGSRLALLAAGGFCSLQHEYKLTFFVTDSHHFFR